MKHSSSVWHIRIPKVINKNLTAGQVLWSLLTARLTQNMALPSWYKSGGDKNKQTKTFPLRSCCHRKGYNFIKGIQFPFQGWPCLLTQGWKPDSWLAIRSNTSKTKLTQVAIVISIGLILGFLQKTLSTWKYCTAKVIWIMWVPLLDKQNFMEGRWAL